MLHIKIFSFTRILFEYPLYLSLTLIFYHQSDFWHERRRCSRMQLAVDFLTLFYLSAVFFIFEFLQGYFISFCNFSHLNLASRCSLFSTTWYEAFTITNILLMLYVNTPLIQVLCVPQILQNSLFRISCIILTHRLILSYATSITYIQTQVNLLIPIGSGGASPYP